LAHDSTYIREIECRRAPPAADYDADGGAPAGSPRGIVQLSSLLRVYNSIMGGGLDFAVEVNERLRLQRAMDAARYFGLTELAQLVAGLIEPDLDMSHAASRQDGLDALLGPADTALETAFRIMAAEQLADFGMA
jgi:hypothetical protein